MDLPEEDEARPSKSARKREAHALQSLGERLLALKEVDLARLGLPEPLLEAVLEGKRLRSRSAGARQRQYIGKLMRDIDPEPIQLALEAIGRNPLHGPKPRLG